MEKDDYIWIDYIFDFKENINNSEPMVFTVLLDRKNCQAIPPHGSKDSEWTRLYFNQCDICPLKYEQVKNCPIAYNISGLAACFAEIYSTEKVNIIVKVKERIYQKEDTVQQGLRSILGIYLATSGCPHMQILKPMARFHLPFASMEETIYRHVGNYLISQYYQNKEGKKPDIDLSELLKKYELIDRVNHGMCKRIDKITEADANKNALIILNAIGLLIDMEIKSNLETLRHLFD